MITSPLRSACIRLAHTKPSLRPYLLPLLKTASEGQTFEEAVKGKKFKNPETGNDVSFGSLPAEEQKKVRGEWAKKNKEKGEGEGGEAKSQTYRPMLDYVNDDKNEVWKVYTQTGGSMQHARATMSDAEKDKMREFLTSDINLNQPNEDLADKLVPYKKYNREKAKIQKKYEGPEGRKIREQFMKDNDISLEDLEKMGPKERSVYQHMQDLEGKEVQALNKELSKGTGFKDLTHVMQVIQRAKRNVKPKAKAKK